MGRAPDYAWPTIEDYENDVGFKVNDVFKIGWDMARTTNSFLTQLSEQTQENEDEDEDDDND